MTTEIMDEGKEKEDPVTVDPTAESTGVTPIADSVLDRLFASPVVGRIARGVFGLVSLGSLGSAHADTIATNQAAADAFAGQTPNPPVERITSPEQLEVADYLVEDMRVMGGNQLVGLITVTSDSSKHLVRGEWNEVTGRLQLKDKARLSFFPLAVVGSEVNPDVMAAAGRKGPLVDEGVLWLTEDGGQTSQLLEHGGKTIYDAQFSADGEYIFTVEEDPNSENQTVYYQFDRAGKTWSRLNASFVEGVRIQTMMGATSTTGVYKGYGVSPLDRGYYEVVTDTINKTVSIRQFNPNEGFIMSKLTQFTDSQGRNHIVALSNDFESPDNPGEATGKFFDNVDNIPSSAFLKASFYSAMRGSILAEGVAVDILGGRVYIGVGFQDVNNIDHPFIESYPIGDIANLDKRQLITILTGGSRGSVLWNGVQILQHGQDRYVVASVKYSINSADNGAYLKKITGLDAPIEKATVILMPGGYKVYIPVVTKNSSAGW